MTQSLTPEGLAALDAALNLRRLRGQERLTDEEWNLLTGHPHDWEGLRPQAPVLVAARRYALARGGAGTSRDWHALAREAAPFFRGSRRQTEDSWTATEQTELLLLASAEEMMLAVPKRLWNAHVRQLARHLAAWPHLPDYFTHTWTEALDILFSPTDPQRPHFSQVVMAHPAYWRRFSLMSGNEPVDTPPSVRRELRLSALRSDLPPALLGAPHTEACENDAGRVIARIFAQVQALPPLSAPGHPRQGGHINRALLRGVTLPAYSRVPASLDPKAQEVQRWNQREDWRVLLADLGLLMRTNAFIRHQGVSAWEREQTIGAIRSTLQVGSAPRPANRRHFGLSMNLRSSLRVFHPDDPALLRRCLRELWAKYFQPMDIIRPEEHEQLLRLIAGLPPETD